MDTLTHAQAVAILGLPEDCPAAISIPEAGRVSLGLSRNGSYEAAARGDFEIIEVGRLRKVPIIALAMRMVATGARTYILDEDAESRTAVEEESGKSKYAQLKQSPQ